MDDQTLKQELEKAQKENLQLLEQLEEKDKLVKAYYQASAAVLKLETFEDAARKIFDICIDLVGATSGYVALLSDDGMENEVLFLEAGGRPCSVDPSLPMPIRGLRAKSYRDKIVVADNDFMHSKWVEYMPDGHVTLDNVMFSPLNIDNKTVGIMGIANKPEDFNERDKQVASVFGELAAIALRRTRDREKLTALTSELKSSNKDLENFARVLSHDIKEPLRTISSYLTLLQHRYEQQLDENADEFIQFAVDGARRLMEMSDSLLNYARITSKERAFTPIHLGELVKEVAEDLKSLIQESQASITYEALPVITADKVQISQLLQNLIANSIKFRNEAPPAIQIDAQEDYDKTVISVKDNGIGFDSDLYGTKIFLPFKSLNKRNEYPGLGIGLATCKKIVENHGGEIWVESKPGKGAVFYFSIAKEKPTHNKTAE